MTRPTKQPKRKSTAKPRTVDPKAVLEQIAADPKAPAELRYRAAAKLLDRERRSEPKPKAPVEPEVDRITERALQIMTERRRLH